MAGDENMGSEQRFPNLHVLEHPLIQHKLTIMRKRETSTNSFSQLLQEIALLMGYEVTRPLPVALNYETHKI